MAQTLTINPDYKDQVMSHGDVCAKPLSAHSQEELRLLAIQAQSAPQPNALSRCFISLPPLAELQGDKVDAEVAQVIAPETPTVTKKKVPTTPTE